MSSGGNPTGVYAYRDICASGLARGCKRVALTENAGDGGRGDFVIDSWRDSEETREALRDAVAREVMGWEVERIEWAYGGTTLVWHDSAGHPVLTRYSWQPDLRDAQAMEAVDQMLKLGFRFMMEVDEGSACVSFERGSAVSRIDHRDRRVAILRAALGAVSRNDAV